MAKIAGAMAGVLVFTMLFMASILGILVFGIVEMQLSVVFAVACGIGVWAIWNRAEKRRER